jgi:predicted ABC-type ATPase
MSEPDSAELALAAFARDLVEEIVAGRALELAGDPEALELASFNVRAHLRRSPTGKVEQVREHTENRFGTGIPGDQMEHPGGYIPEADWLKGEQEWTAKGEAVWKKNEWKSKGATGKSAPVLAEPPRPEPLKGASAVHPQLHHSTVKLPGDTISGHAHAHVPKPFEVKQPTAQDAALGEAHAALDIHRQANLQRIAAEQAAARAQRTGIPVPGTYAPLDDTQYMLHTLDAENAIAAALDAGHSTDKTETLDGHGQAWKPERAAVHNEIVQKFLDKATTVPSEGKGLMMGGLGGAGKSTVLKKIPEIDLTRYAVVNPDDIKEELARRGMVPQIEGLSPMEASVLTHEESSHIANMIARELLRRRKNLAFDITMSSKGSVAKRLDWLGQHGYRDVQGVFVHIPVETSVERARARHRRGLEKYRQGQGNGGRLVPADLIRSAETKPGSTANRESFDALRHRFTAWQLWDNSGTAPKLVEKSGTPGQGTGITSVEDLMREQKALDTEPAARAAEQGVRSGG